MPCVSLHQNIENQQSIEIAGFSLFINAVWRSQKDFAPCKH